MKDPGSIDSLFHPQTAAKLLGCFLALAAMLPGAEAATITVTDTGDTIAVDGLVTLREAITSANNNADVNADVVAVGAYGTDTIKFNIAGTGVHTIAPLAALPTITDPVIIDGYTQPGSTGNTETHERRRGPVDRTQWGQYPRCEWPHDHGRQLALSGGWSLTASSGASGARCDAITLSGGGSNVIEGNFLGPDAPGTTRFW